MDSHQLKEEIEEDAELLSEEAVGIIEALDLSNDHNLEMARGKAEEILKANPANSIATLVSGLECENRQDWSEAARIYLMGLGQNPDDPGMELGFQTNLDMLRAVRHRWVNDQVDDEWEDVVSFQPKEQKMLVSAHLFKPPWWRLGPLYEALVQDPSETEGRDKHAFLNDLLADAADPHQQRMELRRILYQNMEFLDTVYEYYRLEMLDDWPPDRRLDTQVDHDGHDSDPCTFPFGATPIPQPLQLRALVRLLKDCGVVNGDVRARMLAAAVGRIHLQGRRRVARLCRLVQDYEAEAEDPHDPAAPVDFYDMVETLVRVAAAHGRLAGPPAQRFEALLRRFLRPGAMRRTGDKGLAEFRSPAVQGVLREPAMAARLQRAFDHFVVSYKANQLRVGAVGPRDVTMSLNHVVGMAQRLDEFDPAYNAQRCMETYQLVTGDSGLLPQVTLTASLASFSVTVTRNATVNKLMHITLGVLLYGDVPGLRRRGRRGQRRRGQQLADETKVVKVVCANSSCYVGNFNLKACYPSHMVTYFRFVLLSFRFVLPVLLCVEICPLFPPPPHPTPPHCPPFPPFRRRRRRSTHTTRTRRWCSRSSQSFWCAPRASRAPRAPRASSCPSTSTHSAPARAASCRGKTT
jgi:hypothetical protein